MREGIDRWENEGGAVGPGGRAGATVGQPGRLSTMTAGDEVESRARAGRARSGHRGGRVAAAPEPDDRLSAG